MPKKRSWVKKLNDSRDLPKVVKITGKMSKKWGKGTVVIPAPLEVARLMKEIMEGVMALKVPLIVEVAMGKNWRDME